MACCCFCDAQYEMDLYSQNKAVGILNNISKDRQFTPEEQWKFDYMQYYLFLQSDFFWGDCFCCCFRTHAVGMEAKQFARDNGIRLNMNNCGIIQGIEVPLSGEKIEPTGTVSNNRAATGAVMWRPTNGCCPVISCPTCMCCPCCLPQGLTFTSVLSNGEIIEVRSMIEILQRQNQCLASMQNIPYCGLCIFGSIGYCVNYESMKEFQRVKQQSVKPAMEISSCNSVSMFVYYPNDYPAEVYKQVGRGEQMIRVAPVKGQYMERK